MTNMFGQAEKNRGYLWKKWNCQSSLCNHIIKSPRAHCFWSVSTAAILPTLFNFPGKPLKLISSNHTCLTYGYGKIFWYPSWWPWVKVTKLLKRDRFYLVPMIKWEPVIHLLRWPLNLNFRGHIVSQEWNFKVKSGICYISDKNGLIAMKQKANISIECMTSNGIIGFDLGHDLDLEFSRLNMEFAISQLKMVWLPLNEKQTYRLNSRPHIDHDLERWGVRI